MSTWRFEPLEFQVGWRAFGADRLPYPLQYRPTTTDMADYARQCCSAARQFGLQLDDELHWAFGVLFDPEVRLHACGYAGADGDSSKIRIYGGTRGQHAVVARQVPGADPRTGGTVHLACIPRSECGARLVHALPSFGPGSHAPAEIDERDLEPTGAGAAAGYTTDRRTTSWLQSPIGRATPAASLVRRLRPHRVGVGRIEVYRGPAGDLRDTGGGRDIRWIDIADDGRYLAIPSGRSVAVRPGDPEAFARLIDQLITRVGRGDFADPIGTSQTF